MGRLRTACVIVAVTILIATPIGAEIIDFEDPPATNDSQMIVGEEYAGLGVHFVATDDGATWGGMTAGQDPGGWQIAGTNGPTFLGFDGQGYAMELQFDDPVEGFEIDVARAAGGLLAGGEMFILAGFLGDEMVESNGAFFGGVDDWARVVLTSTLDRVVWFGTFLPGQGDRFGVDNLSWVGLAPPTQTMAVDIDVHPGSERNPIQLRSRGVVPVVLYGEQDFAVENVDVDTLAFGPNGAPVACRNGPHFDYIDGDGVLDMLIHHRIGETGIVPNDVEACLTGDTLNGMMFEACDLVTPVSGR